MSLHTLNKDPTTTTTTTEASKVVKLPQKVAVEHTLWVRGKIWIPQHGIKTLNHPVNWKIRNVGTLLISLYHSSTKSLINKSRTSLKGSSMMVAPKINMSKFFKLTCYIISIQIQIHRNSHIERATLIHTKYINFSHNRNKNSDHHLAKSYIYLISVYPISKSVLI